MEAIGFLFGFTLYFGSIAFAIWFAVTVVKLLRENNKVLKDIAEKLEQIKEHEK